MFLSHTRLSHERRRSERTPVGFYVQQYIDGEPHRCFARHMSSKGIYLERLAGSVGRDSNRVELEILLPGCGQPIWASGEVVYDRVEPLFHCTAVRFLEMGPSDASLLREWLRQSGRDELFAESD